MSVMDLLEDAWDGIVDGFDYFIHFEWIGDVGDFISAMFENLDEFSFLGLTFGFLAIGVSYGTKYLQLLGNQHMTLIAVMVQHMPPAQKVIWTILSYVAAFVAGYFVGNRFENT